MENAEEEGSRLAQDIQRRLAESAEPATRVWFEERVRLGRWRGNKSDSSRRAVFAAVAQWMGEESGAGGGIRWGGGVARYYAALALMRSVYSDDKLAGMILFQVRARFRSRNQKKQITAQTHADEPSRTTFLEVFFPVLFSLSVASVAPTQTTTATWMLCWTTRIVPCLEVHAPPCD